jgi:hypothetical protein
MKINTAFLGGLIVLSTFHSNKANAQSNGNGLFSKGDNVISAGVGLGGTYSYVSSGYTQSPTIQFGAYIGARYYFTNNFGLNAELVVMNNAYNYIGLGITFKF